MSKVNFVPNGDKILIKPILAEAPSKNLTVIGNVRNTSEFKGEIVAVGPGKNGRALTEKVGDIILYTMVGAQRIEIDDVAHVIMSAQDHLGTLSSK